MDGVRGGLRVLVADGYKDAANSLALLLTLWGHTPRVVHSGGAALDEAARFRPQVALLEIVLGRINGFALARQLRRDFGSGIALIALATHMNAERRRRARASGFNLGLVKPADPEELRVILARQECAFSICAGN